MPIDQAILHSKFDTFFNELKAMEPRVDKIDHPLKKDPQFHDLKADESEDLRNYKAAYNLALTMKIAFEKNSWRIFIPAPITASSAKLTEDLSKVDPKLINIFLPVIQFTSENINSLIPWGMETVARKYVNQLNATKTAIEKMPLQAAISENANAAKREPTESEKYQAKINEIEQKFLENAKECQFIRTNLQEIQTRNNDKYKVDNIKYLAEQARALVDREKLAEMNKDLMSAQEDMHVALKMVEEEKRRLKVDKEDWKSFQAALAKKSIPPFNEEIAKLLNLSNLEKDSWQRLSEMSGESRIYSFFVTKVSGFIDYMVGEEPKLTSSSMLTILNKGASRVANDLAGLDAEHNKLQGQQKILSQLSDTIYRASAQADYIHNLADEIAEENLNLNLKIKTDKLINALERYINLIKPKTLSGRIWAYMSNKDNLIAQLELTKGSIEKEAKAGKFISNVAIPIPKKKKLSRLFEAKEATVVAKTINYMAMDLGRLKK